ncbi:cytochrome P450 [Cryptosporangium arvum]|uniref:Cytochrome P450 n=1 Tax=Cryptosporangium arvum DSM 44712 TaxID=927661 RepID=A0A010Z5H4_9ACTN|nr:cytochrome P450 [Cryptosporangium arvum]EXG82598.1 cytochrome P450 [Cryptosporangium arvum DSM 44712]
MGESTFAVPVAPGRQPLVGHMPALARDVVGFFESLRDVGDVVEVRFGRTPVYVITDAELVHRAMAADSGDFVQGKLYDKLARVAGGGVACTDGPGHLDQRRALLPAFRPARNAEFADLFREQALELSRSWRPGQPVNLLRDMYRLTTRTTARALLGGDLDDADTNWLADNIPFVFSIFALQTLSPSDLLEHLPTATNRRYAAVRERLRAIVDDVVGRSSGDGDDIVSTLRRAHHGGDAADEVATILITAIEPTATVIAWLFYYLARNPAVEARVHDEPAYLRPVITEVLRLRHPIYFVMRRTVREVRLGSWPLPAGADVLWSNAALHRDPAAFPDPHVFDPDRWASGEPPHRHYLPFGGGAHKCLGHRFATSEIDVVVSTITERWRLVLDPDVEIPLGVLHPDEMPVSVVARDGRP